MSSENALKRKRNEEKANDPKLQEYLALIQNSGKTRTWANDDNIPQPSEAPALAINQPTQDNSVTEELPSHPKKARTQESFVGVSDQAPQPMVVDHSGEDKAETSQAQDDQKASEAEAGAVSDMDWLRSKTSRLLGLLDEDEQADFEQRTVDEPAESQSPVHDESRSAAIEHIGSQDLTNADDTAEATETTPEQDANIELIRASARLFLRNLAYDVTEDDLHPLFSPFGKTEEVSTCFLTHFSPSHSIQPASLCYLAQKLAPCSYDDYPDRDIRCQSANDVNRQEILVDASWFSEEQHSHFPCTQS